MISLNGAAARKAAVGDRIIICAYGPMTEDEVAQHKPRLVYLDAQNNIVRTSKDIPLQLA
jgi:aspartate 1-decarboxylase